MLFDQNGVPIFKDPRTDEMVKDERVTTVGPHNFHIAVLTMLVYGAQPGLMQSEEHRNEMRRVMEIAANAVMDAEPRPESRILALSIFLEGAQFAHQLRDGMIAGQLQMLQEARDKFSTDGQKFSLN